MPAKSEYIKIAEGDGGIEVVSRALYDRVYGDMKQILDKEGAARPAPVRGEPARACQARGYDNHAYRRPKTEGWRYKAPDFRRG